MVCVHHGCGMAAMSIQHARKRKLPVSTEHLAEVVQAEVCLICNKGIHACVWACYNHLMILSDVCLYSCLHSIILIVILIMIVKSLSSS